MQFFLGIDGGQSSTTALIGDASGRILGSGSGGPCNHVGASEGRAKFFSAIGGSLARKKVVPATAGTFPTGTPLFSGLLFGVVLIVVGLTYFPVVALGPVVEHLVGHF